MKMMAQAGCDSEACYDQNGTLTIITALFSEQPTFPTIPTYPM
jgi:hypothetical protein